VNAVRPEKIVALVDDEQAAALTAPAGPLLVVAGAGSGKTRTLTCRIAYRAATGDAHPATVLAVTHSTRAAGELRDRLLRLRVPDLDQVQARTLHAAALRQLRYFWDQTGRPHPLTICEDRYGALRAALAQLRVRAPDPGMVADLLAEIEWAKARRLDPDQYPEQAHSAGRAAPVSPARVAAAYRGYQQQLAAAGQLDFTDLLTTLSALIADKPVVAAKIRSRYRSIYVDEYQDTDPAQQQLLDAWLGRNADITAVGDPRQAIYAFKGSDPQLLADFPARYPDARVVTLTRDYRSTEQIVTVVNALAAAADPDPGPRPRTKAGKAAWDAAHPAPLRPAGGSGPSATARTLPDEDAEARWVAAQIRAAIRSGVTPGQIAVLYRFNSQSAPFEQALSAAGIAHRVEGGQRFFDRPEIVAVLQEYAGRIELLLTPARSAADYDDSYAEYDGDDATGDVTLPSGPDLLLEVLADLGWRRDTPPDGAGAARDRWEGVTALVHLVEDTPTLAGLGAVELLTELASRREHAHSATVNAVTLATVHKAKGLEWDVVFCPRWVEGSFPSSLARTGAALAEERRLVYVATSRARKHLTITWSQTRAGGRAATASRFLAEAGFDTGAGQTTAAASVAGVRRPRRSGGPSSPARCARCKVPLEHPALAAVSACAHHLPGDAARRLARLRQWRTERAKLDAVKPYQVLTDATLFHLAAAPPVDSGTLAAVPGIGPAKLAGYGAELLALLR